MWIPGISAKLDQHPTDGRTIVLLRVYKADVHDIKLALPYSIAEEFADALKALLREARHSADPGDGTTVIGALQLPAGTQVAFTMIPDPDDSQMALEVVITPVPTTAISSDDGTPPEEAPESFSGVLKTPGDRSLFIGELSRCARLARLRAGTS